MTTVDDRLEAQYDNRALVPDHPDIFDRWSREAAAFRKSAMDAARAELNVPYGPHARHVYDYFRADPSAAPAPRTAVFVHGGYWRALDKSYFSHMAGCLTVRGFDVVVINYRLCPEVRIADIMEDVEMAAASIFRTSGRPLLPYGHSAGGHLVSCLLATDWQRRGLPADLTQAGLVVSGVYDLIPLLKVSVNADLKLTEDAATAASPLFWQPPELTGLAVVAGGAESDAFQDQSRRFHTAWSQSAGRSTLDIVEGANHFTVIDPLADPDSAMAKRLTDLCPIT